MTEITIKIQVRDRADREDLVVKVLKQYLGSNMLEIDMLDYLDSEIDHEAHLTITVL